MPVWALFYFFDKHSTLKEYFELVFYPIFLIPTILVAIPFLLFYKGADEETRWAKNTFVRGIGLFIAPKMTDQYSKMSNFKRTVKRMIA